MYHNQAKTEDRKTARVPRMSEVSSGVLLMGQQAVYRDESGPCSALLCEDQLC